MFRCLLLVLASLLSTGYSWFLTTTQNNAIPNLTNNITLDCVPRNQNSIGTQVTLIQILKQDKNNRWNGYARITSNGNSTVELLNSDAQDIDISGQIGDESRSYLSVTWKTPSVTCYGVYVCEIDVFDVHHDAQFFVRTTNVTITDTMSTSNLLKTILKTVEIAASESKERERKINKMMGKIRRIESSNQDLLNATGTIIKQLESMDDKPDRSQQVTMTCQDGWYLYKPTKSCIQIFKHNGFDWYDARKYCQKHQGDLAKIINQNMNEFVFNLTKIEHRSSSDHVWMGLNDKTTEGTFNWLDETLPASYTNFDDDSNSDANDCFILYTLAGHWYPNSCTFKFQYTMCESAATISPVE